MYPYYSSFMQNNRTGETGSQKPTYTITNTIPVYLGGKPGTERVVLYSSTSDGLKAKAEIQRFDTESKTWKADYSQETLGIQTFMVLNGYWEAIGQNVVVLYYNAGSGSFLTYTVLGRKERKIVELLKREDIFQGSVYLETVKLIEAHGLRQYLWANHRRHLVLLPYQIPLIPGARVIKFSIAENGTVQILQKKLQVPVGSTVQIIRTDLNPITERVLYGFNTSVPYIPPKNAFKATEKGTISITIIPDGYDWDKAVELTIQVV